MDSRRSERLAGSFLASLIVHALLAMLLFSIISSSSEQAPSESVSGAEIVTVSSRTVAAARAPAAPAQQVAPPQPQAPRVAPPHAQQQRAAQPHPRVLHELAKFAPTAPPNPTPLPAASSLPNPVPTQEVLVSSPAPIVAAIPTSVPSPRIVAISVKPPPTSAPSPLPTIVPTAQPTPKPQPTLAPTKAPPTPAPPAPTIAPTRKPATPVPATAAPTASPTAAPPVAVARATAVPSPVAASPAPRPTTHPTPGVPSPGPTTAPPTAAPHRGASETPGPKPAGSPGSAAGPKNVAAPANRPVQVQPTPTPAPSPSPSPRPQPTHAGIDLNAKLRSLIPTEAVNPTHHTFTGDLAQVGSNVRPTPPPDVLARTKFTYQEAGRRSGQEASLFMYVTDVHRDGPVTRCTGWLLRYPKPESQFGTLSDQTLNTGRLDPTHPESPERTYRGAPIVEANVTFICDSALLKPYAPPPGT